MSFVAGAIAIGAGSVIGAYGQMAAAGTQASAMNGATAAQRQMFNTIQQNEQPYMAGGGQALNTILYGEGIGGTADGSGVGQGQFTKGFTPADMTANMDPAYGFMQQQGANAVRNADTPNEGALSGGALKDLMSFNQNYALNGYQNSFNNWTTNQNNVFNRLSTIAGLGQNAAAGVGNNGSQISGGIASSIAGAGSAAAGGQLGAANAISGGLNSYAGYSMLGSMMHPGGASSISPSTMAYANSQADPLAALNAAQGWTTSTAPGG